jgi:hypothetical protein
VRLGEDAVDHARHNAESPGVAGAFASGVSSSPVVIAGLDPAIPIMWHSRAMLSGMGGSSPAMTIQ